MLYIPPIKTDDEWSTLGKIAGLALGKAYEARTSREAAKQKEYQKAQEMYDIQNQQNQALQSAYNAYDTAKNNQLAKMREAATNYNNNPTPENYQTLIKYVKETDPTMEINENAMTQAILKTQNGESEALKPYRQQAKSAAQAINPYVDFKSGNWGTDTYNMGVNRANYTKNYKDFNKGRTVNGKGDKKFQEFADYNPTNPYNAMSSGPLQNPSQLGQANPIQLNLNPQQSNTMQLQNAQPLTHFFNFNNLEQYVK